jgi:ABC-type nitrate/sulfonate/bicarbonate transport system substrate-binding protein
MIQNIASRRIIIIVCIFLLSIAGVILYSAFNTVSHKETLVIAEAQQPVFALLYVAEANGYFREEGLEVTYNKFTLGRDALDDTIKGGSDVAIVYETPFVRKVYEGVPIKLISTLHRSNRNQGVFTESGRGINTFSDIKGKRIGVVRNTSSEFFLFSLLAGEGIARSDVILEYVESDELIQYFDDGKVDAVSVWNPLLYQLKSEYPEEKQRIFYSDMYSESSVFVVRDENIIRKKSALVKMLRALVRAEKFTKNNPEQSIHITAQALSVPESEVRAVWDDFTHSVQLNNLLLLILEREALWFKDNQIYTGPLPNFRNYIITDYLKEAKPDGVTLN